MVMVHGVDRVCVWQWIKERWTMPDGFLPSWGALWSPLGCVSLPGFKVRRLMLH